MMRDIGAIEAERRERHLERVKEEAQKEARRDDIYRKIDRIYDGLEILMKGKGLEI